jgi:mannose-6-phosphate isomerase-like protein (cupin superfamily)
LIRYAAARSAIADALENFERRTSAAMELCVEASVNLDEKLGGFDEIYQPRMISEFNGHAVMVVKAKGSFVWHSHPETDDFFLVLKGRMTIHLRDRDIVLGPGDLYVVPRGVEHCPEAHEETHVLLIEPVGTPNTGSAETAAPIVRA